MSDEELAVEDDTPTQPIKAMDDSTTQEDIDFIAQHQLPQHTQSQHTDYDHDFVMQIAAGYTIYRPLIAQLVTPYTDKFHYDEMSLTRRAILLLGYAEYKVMSTPASIIINECVELAKSYEDTAAGKLINGIMHQLLEIKDTEPAGIIKAPKSKKSKIVESGEK
jgi:transcription termination factor NusB